MCQRLPIILLPIVFLACIWPHVAQGQLARQSNAFLGLPITARSEALGRSDQADSYYPGMERINPASLSSQRAAHTVGGTFSSHFGGMANLGVAAWAMRVDSLSGVGVSLVRFGVSGIQNTLRWMDGEGQTDYGRISRFSVADYALFAAYGREMDVPGLAVGGAVKVIYRHAGGFANGVGIGVDAGIRYARGNWSASLVGRDITTTWTFWMLRAGRLAVPENDTLRNATPDGAFEMAMPSLEVSAGYLLPFGSHFSLGLQLAAQATFDGPSHGVVSGDFFSLHPAIGVWGGYRDILFVRLGARQFQITEEYLGRKTLSFAPSAGVGVQAFGCTLDYAFSAPLTGVTMRFSHIISLGVRLGQGSGRPSRPAAPPTLGAGALP